MEKGEGEGGVRGHGSNILSIILTSHNRYLHDIGKFHKVSQREREREREYTTHTTTLLHLCMCMYTYILFAHICTLALKDYMYSKCTHSTHTNENTHI